MGTDNLHHRRKAKKVNELNRKKPQKSPYDKVLIVCEGEKTEPNYFKELVNHYKINTTNVEIDGSCGSSPISVVNRAIELDQETAKGNSYDKVYCVFDRDNHETYTKALECLSRKRKFFHATSIPCFEYWLILHFKFTTKPYSSTGKTSSGDKAFHDLKEYIPDYEKGSQGIFSKLINKLDSAIKNAKQAKQQAEENKTDNPSTLVHELIDYLRNINRS